MLSLFFRLAVKKANTKSILSHVRLDLQNQTQRAQGVEIRD